MGSREWGKFPFPIDVPVSIDWWRNIAGCDYLSQDITDRCVRRDDDDDRKDESNHHKECNIGHRFDRCWLPVDRTAIRHTKKIHLITIAALRIFMLAAHAFTWFRDFRSRSGPIRRAAATWRRKRTAKCRRCIGRCLFRAYTRSAPASCGSSVGGRRPGRSGSILRRSLGEFWATNNEVG